MNDYVLSLKDICKRYKQGNIVIKILDDLSFNVSRGEVIGIVGPSGCGKTTLLNICGLLDNADSGEIILDGTNLSGMNENKQNSMRGRKLGFIYQFHHLLPDFTALENVMIPAMVNGLNLKEKEAAAKSILDNFGLNSRINHYPNQLSGGEQQRVAIARAFINDPKLILADEPTGNLDPVTAGKVMEHMLSFMRSSNQSAIIVTHNHSLIEKFDRVLIFEQGKMVIYEK